jgi:hypothetical protein
MSPKMWQNAFLPKLIHNFLPWKKAAQNLGYCCIFKKLPKEYNRPIGENSPNMVTLNLCTLQRVNVRDSI